MRPGAMLFNAGHSNREMDIDWLYQQPHQRLKAHIERVEIGEHFLFLLAKGSLLQSGCRGRPAWAWICSTITRPSCCWGWPGCLTASPRHFAWAAIVPGPSGTGDCRIVDQDARLATQGNRAMQPGLHQGRFAFRHGCRDCLGGGRAGTGRSFGSLGRSVPDLFLVGTPQPLALPRARAYSLTTQGR